MKKAQFCAVKKKHVHKITSHDPIGFRLLMGLFLALTLIRLGFLRVVFSEGRGAEFQEELI